MFKKSLKKFVIAVLIMSFVTVTSGCGDVKNIEGTTYDTYGLINKDENKNPNIKYRIVIGNIVWSVLLCQTIIAPIYFIGFSMYEPVRKTTPDEEKGSV